MYVYVNKYVYIYIYVSIYIYIYIYICIHIYVYLEYLCIDTVYIYILLYTHLYDKPNFDGNCGDEAEIYSDDLVISRFTD